MISWFGNNSNSGKGVAAADLDQKGKQILLVNDEKEENDNGFIAAVAIGGAVAALAVAGLAVWGIGSLLSGSSSSSSTTDKTMKAPGRNYRIPRDFFEKDPAGYFRNLRKS